MTEIRKRGRIKNIIRESENKTFREENEESNINNQELRVAENGTLISIELENWMNIKGPTKYCFNNGVNIVTGLNGSGKSSVACGIAVSLGYDTHILARGHYLSSYIRNGSKSCRLSIVIKNENDEEHEYMTKIERLITTIESNKVNKTNSQLEIRSSWKLNGKKCLERDIIALRKELNIQLDNMVAFLAQQRVSQFGNQSPQDIFIDTLRIISNDNLRSKNLQNEIKRSEVTLCEFEFNEDNLLNVYNQFLYIFKDSKDCKLKHNDYKTRLSQLSNEISKSKQNEIKYIQYLLHKMGIYLIQFFQSLKEISTDKSALLSLDDKKKKVIKELTQVRKELRKQENDSSQLLKDLELTKKENDEFLRNIQVEKLDKKYKSFINNLDQVINHLKENYEDPKLLLERYSIKKTRIQDQITEAEKKIRYIMQQFDNEWKTKLIKCKLYDENFPQKFDKVMAERKRKILGESVAEINHKITSKQRNIKEFEFNISKLNEKKASNKFSHLSSNRENLLREKYLRNVNQKVLSTSKRENIIKYFQKLTEYSGFQNYLPKKKVIGPIGSYISIKNDKFQPLIEAFLQQFHYYFISDKEDVKLLSERYRLNVLTLSNYKPPIYPKLDDELRKLGITGFLHEHLDLQDETIKNILYQISAQFFTCVIIDNPLLTGEIQEDQILYKLSDWFKEKYDQPGNKVSNNVHLFITHQTGTNYLNSKNGVLFKLITSIYNPNSKTISMVNLRENMNTILLNDDFVKEEENSQIPQVNQQILSIDKEIQQLEFNIKESNKNLEDLKELYDGEIMLLNIINDCISNIPSLFERLTQLKSQLEVLEKELNENIPNEAEIKLKNQNLIKTAFLGENSNQVCIFNELTKIKTLFEEISIHDFKKNKELSGKLHELNTNYSSFEKEITQKKEEMRQLEQMMNQISKDYDNITSTLEIKSKACIDSYLQYYSTYCQYYKRFKYNDFNKELNKSSNEKIYEFIYNKVGKYENNTSQDQQNVNNELNWENSIKKVPGVEFFSSIITGNKSSSKNGEKIPSYCLEMLSQVSLEFELIKCSHSHFEEILNNTLKNLSQLNHETEEENTLKNGFDLEKNLTLFDILLDNDQYKIKYENLFNIITSLEAKTHNTNLERMADLEQEFEILSKSCEDLSNRMSTYEEFVIKNYNKWLDKLKMIEDFTCHCFGIFMRFINENHNGKIIIPFINNFQLFINNSKNASNEAIFNYFIENFEKDSKLNIMVRFSPDEDLRLFSSNSVSGGEQSLCTILFILSLQVSSNL